MMLTKRININILHNNQLIMILMKHRPIHNVPQILLIPLRKPHHRFRIPLGRAVQTLPIWVLPYAFENRPHGARKLCESSFGVGRVLAFVKPGEGANGGPAEAVEVNCGVRREWGSGACC